MSFEIVSFLIGVIAGAITGGLAAMLHGLERVADLQERVRKAAREIEKLKALDPLNKDGVDEKPKLGLNDLQRDLNEINEEIRRMYKRN